MWAQRSEQKELQLLVTRVKAKPLELALGFVPALGFLLVLGFEQVPEKEFTPQSPELVIEEPLQLFQVIHRQVARDHLCFSRNQTSRIC